MGRMGAESLDVSHVSRLSPVPGGITHGSPNQRKENIRNVNHEQTVQMTHNRKDDSR
jgi:hypothetical protein